MDFNIKRLWGPAPSYPNVENYMRPKDGMIVIAGPCSVESKEQIFDIAERVMESGATHLRGGVFRAGTYPGKNFGLQTNLLKELHQTANYFELPNIVEVLDYSPEQLELVLENADCLQIGSRSMQNYTLLKKVAETNKPVFLKRNQGSTLDEWLGAAEHLLTNGCGPIHLIERGSSTFENHCRWSLSISMIAAAKQITNIPIIVDAAHGSGRRDLVEPLTLAGIAAGADGLLCEVHTDPDKSLSDSEQALTPDQFYSLMGKVEKIREVICE